MATAGPTPAHMRWAVRSSLGDLYDALELANNDNMSFSGLGLKRPADKSHFAVLSLTFYRINFDKYITYDLELSNNYLPRFVHTVSDHEYLLFPIDVLNLWALKNIPLF